MKNAFKVAAWSVFAFVVLAVVAVVSMPLWIGGVVTCVANRKVPQMTGTDFSLREFALNPYTGKAHLGDMTLYNPPSYVERRAASVGRLYVEFDTGSLLSDTIVVRDILVEDLFVSWVDVSGTNNFDQIGSNVSASRQEAARPASAEASTAAPEKAGETAEAGAAEKRERKVIIDRLTVKDLKVNWMGITLPLPTVVITGIGRNEGGVSWATAGNEIANAVMKKIGELGGGLFKLGAVLKDAASTNSADAMFDALTDGLRAVEDGSKGSLQNAGDALKESRDALKTLFKGVKIKKIK